MRTNLYYTNVPNAMKKELNMPASVVYVCTGSKCKKHGSKEISKLLRVYAKEHKLKEVSIIKTHCTDNCKHGPVVCFQPDNAWHFHVGEQKAIELMKKYYAPRHPGFDQADNTGEN